MKTILTFLESSKRKLKLLESPEQKPTGKIFEKLSMLFSKKHEKIFKIRSKLLENFLANIE